MPPIMLHGIVPSTRVLRGRSPLAYSPRTGQVLSPLTSAEETRRLYETEDNRDALLDFYGTLGHPCKTWPLWIPKDDRNISTKEFRDLFPEDCTNSDCRVRNRMNAPIIIKVSDKRLVLGFYDAIHTPSENIDLIWDSCRATDVTAQRLPDKDCVPDEPLPPPDTFDVVEGLRLGYYVHEARPPFTRRGEMRFILSHDKFTTTGGIHRDERALSENPCRPQLFIKYTPNCEPIGLLTIGPKEERDGYLQTLAEYAHGKSAEYFAAAFEMLKKDKTS